ncbi:hypothetical protein HAX54_009795, partial [Datura stramonium]|nr:hypothetical protein [Datura stramonium]
EQLAEIEVRIKYAELEVVKNYQSTVLTLNADLECARAKIEQQQAELAEEKANSDHIESTVKGQLQPATTRVTQIAELAASRQQQLQGYEQKKEKVAGLLAFWLVARITPGLKVKQQWLTKTHRAWVCGLPPSMFPADNSDNPPNLRPLSHAKFSTSADPSPQHAQGYTPFHLYLGTSTVCAPTPQHRMNSLLYPQLLQPL